MHVIICLNKIRNWMWRVRWKPNCKWEQLPWLPWRHGKVFVLMSPKTRKQGLRAAWARVGTETSAYCSWDSQRTILSGERESQTTTTITKQKQTNKRKTVSKPEKAEYKEASLSPPTLPLERVKSFVRILRTHLYFCRFGIHFYTTSMVQETPNQKINLEKGHLRYLNPDHLRFSSHTSSKFKHMRKHRQNRHESHN